MGALADRQEVAGRVVHVSGFRADVRRRAARAFK
jgi:hypothetical protein